jgi:signal transduction histidine kinase
MSEVSCRTCAPLVEAFEEAGIPLAKLVEGLPIAPETLLRPSNRITWNEFTVILENVARNLGGPEGLEETSVRYYERAGGLLGAVAARVSSARPLYHMGAKWYGPSLFSATRAACEDMPDGRIRQTIEILPGFKPCPLYFISMRGALRGIPALLGQGQAQVEMEADERRAVFLIKPPPSLTIWARLRRALFWERDLERASEEFEVQRDELRHGYDLARRTNELLSFQTRRLEHEQHERQHAENLLLQVQKLETIGRLAGGISHDFNNVLTTILGYVDVALDRVDSDDPLHSELHEIRAMGERGSALVQQLLSVGRPQPVSPRRILLNEVLVTLESMLRRLLPAAIQVAVLPASEPLEVVADPGQLEQVVLNLAINARDAMPRGGRLEMELRRASSREAGQPESLGSGDFARLEVRDTGEGMDAETRARALEPFYTTKAAGQGSGLGLASAHTIVMRAGGSIHIESEVGKGTSIVIYLPLAGGPRPPQS